MSIILFIIILGVLIFVHELGHFLIAKWAKIRVDEFAIGFPPKIISFKPKQGQTRYALNLIPFGGYVKIFGENPDDASLDPSAKDSFVNKNRWVQAAVLIAGVVFNAIFAWLLFSISFMSGMPSVVTEENRAQIENPEVVITSVAADSPAMDSGLAVGDAITGISTVTSDDIADVSDVAMIQEFIANNPESEIQLYIDRADTEEVIVVTPTDGIVEGKKAIGIVMGMIGTLQLGPIDAVLEGAKATGIMTKEITLGLGRFFGDIFTGQADLNQVSGPVGIVGLVGDASEFGLIYLFGFTAFISLNLAVLNLVPFPALDGGRLLFLLIEGITRRQIPVKVANTLNAVGFFILITLMIVITVSDVIKLF